MERSMGKQSGTLVGAGSLLPLWLLLLSCCLGVLAALLLSGTGSTHGGSFKLAKGGANLSFGISKMLA